MLQADCTRVTGQHDMLEPPPSAHLPSYVVLAYTIAGYVLSTIFQAISAELGQEDYSLASRRFAWILKLIVSITAQIYWLCTYVRKVGLFYSVCYLCCEIFTSDSLIRTAADFLLSLLAQHFHKIAEKLSDPQLRT